MKERTCPRAYKQKKKIKRKCLEKLYAYVFRNFDEMDNGVGSTYTNDHFLKLLVL